MAKTGRPKEGLNGGYKPTEAGYIRIFCKESNRKRFEHNLVWEKAYGPIPEGFHIHHINGIKHDNRIENLECISPKEHKKIHAGIRKNSYGRWVRNCNKCGVVKDVDRDFYFSKTRSCSFAECKPCFISRVNKDRVARDV